MYCYGTRREWRQFYYEPKVLKFFYESESSQVNDFSEGVTLPQFSSASVSVPKVSLIKCDFVCAFVFYRVHFGV